MRSKGTGSVVKLKGTKDPITGKQPESKYWYILYYVDGRQVRESSKTESKMEAEALLQRRLGEAGLGVRPEQDVKNVKYEEVRDSLLAEYINQNRGSIFTRADGTKYVVSFKHLDKFFKGMPVVRITPDVLRRFIEARRKEGAKDPTIRKNLVILRSMLKANSGYRTCHTSRCRKIVNQPDGTSSRKRSQRCYPTCPNHSGRSSRSSITPRAVSVPRWQLLGKW
jgi:hypothetical protein